MTNQTALSSYVPSPNTPECCTYEKTASWRHARETKNSSSITAAQLGPECFSRPLQQKFPPAKGILKMQSGLAVAGPEILYHLLKGKTFVLKSDTAGSPTIWVIHFDSMCVHLQTELESFSKTFCRVVLRSQVTVHMIQRSHKLTKRNATDSIGVWIKPDITLNRVVLITDNSLFLVWSHRNQMLVVYTVTPKQIERVFFKKKPGCILSW